MAKNDRVYDELFCFLEDALFQVPVRTFLDEHCTIFDPSISPAECMEDHRKIHENYKKLVDALLEGFCEDSQLSMDKAIKGIKSMNQVSDLPEYCQAIFEQVLASVDFDIFFRLMCKRNIIIQEQALYVLIKMLGSAPASLVQDLGSPQDTQKKSTMVSQEKEDEEILRKTLQQSKKEEEKKIAQSRQEQKDLQKTLLLSQQEATLLSKDKETLDEDMKRLTMEDRPAPKQPSKGAEAAPPLIRPLVSMQSNISSSQAASDWMKSAQSENTPTPQQAAVMAQMSKLSPDELKKRQDYLKEQRDKLLAMKKQQREKQLLTAEKANPKRPQSARAARAAMDKSAQSTSQSEEDQKKMAMRKAIADKLKMEVIGKQ